MRLPLLLALCLTIMVQGQEETCQSTDEDPYLLFGTKTAYTVANKGIPVTNAHDVPGCQPIAIWLLSRHASHQFVGETSPTILQLVKLRHDINKNYKNGNFRNTSLRMCMSDLNLLEQFDLMERWERQNIIINVGITSEGYNTTQQLAEAWKRKFPGLFTDNVHDYLFKYYEYDQKSATTLQAFTESLFRGQAENFNITKESDEELLRPYRFCTSWDHDVEKNNDTLSQLRTFESKQEYKEMLNNVSRRLGFNYDLEKETLLNMYDMCRYIKSWDLAEISPWCAAFTKEDLKRLEYSEDLLTYYKYGYGSPKNQEMGCTSVKEMMDFFKTHVESDKPQLPRTIVLFVEAPLLLLTLQALGAHRDAAPLTADNYHSAAVQNRRWSTSAMSPFNANLAAVLYKCTLNSNVQINEPYQVLFLENERPLNLEECRVGLCNWTYVKNRFADNCNLNYCNSSATKTNGFLGLCLALVMFVSKVI